MGKRKEIRKEGIKGCENQAKNLDSDGGKEISIVNNDKEIWKRKKFRKNRPPRGIRNGEGSGTPTNSEGNQRRRQFNKEKYNERPKNQGEERIPMKLKAEEWNKVNGRKEHQIEGKDSTSGEEKENQKNQIVNELIGEILKKSECKIYRNNIIRVILTDDDPVIEITPRRRKILTEQMQINEVERKQDFIKNTEETREIKEIRKKEQKVFAKNRFEESVINRNLSEKEGLEILKETTEDSGGEKILTIGDPEPGGNLKEKRNSVIKGKSSYKNTYRRSPRRSRYGEP